VLVCVDIHYCVNAGFRRAFRCTLGRVLISLRLTAGLHQVHADAWTIEHVGPANETLSTRALNRGQDYASAKKNDKNLVFTGNDALTLKNIQKSGHTNLVFVLYFTNELIICVRSRPTEYPVAAVQVPCTPELGTQRWEHRLTGKTCFPIQTAS
jgi:hypothetical protein